MHSLRRRFTWRSASALAAVCFVGALFRETMLIAPIAFIFGNVTFGRETDGAQSVPLRARLLPLAAAAIGVVLCRRIHVEPRRTLSAVENAIYLFHTKPLFTLPLAMFLTFGPVLAVVLYDWRAVRDVIGQHVYLAVFFTGCFAAGYLGGHETERYLIWSAPTVYLLIAIALQNHRVALLRSAWVFTALVIAQALSERVFFGIPDPSLAVGDWSALMTPGQKIWGAINRLVIVDDFSWNLWSYFGSRPFHMLSLGIYVAFSVSIITYLWCVERTGAST
jgi:hypothetical protein